MFKRVLLCYDGSVAGRRALRRGADLAVHLGAQVYVLSIIPGGRDGPGGGRRCHRSRVHRRGRSWLS